jgi:hypothetical protein
MTDYEALKAYGFSPVKAAEIVLDASRCDAYALTVVAIARASV